MIGSSLGLMSLAGSALGIGTSSAGFLLTTGLKLASYGINTTGEILRGQFDEPALNRSLTDPNVIIIPYKISIDPQKKRKFLEDVEKLQLRDQRKYTTIKGNPDKVHFIKIPAHIHKNEELYLKTLSQIKQLESKIGWKLKPILID